MKILLTLKKHMPDNKTELQEQEAPVKNTDNAFVKVDADGKPSIPKDEANNNETNSREEEG